MIKEREMLTLQQAFDKAINNPENFHEDGSVNWNFIDADVYMDSDASTGAYTQTQYLEKFNDMCDKWEESN